MKPIKFDHWAGVVSVSFLRKGSFDVSLHSGAFTSPADCVLRIIKFECQKGTIHAACFKLLSGTGIPFTVFYMNRIPGL